MARPSIRILALVVLFYKLLLLPSPVIAQMRVPKVQLVSQRSKDSTDIAELRKKPDEIIKVMFASGTRDITLSSQTQILKVAESLKAWVDRYLNTPIATIRRFKYFVLIGEYYEWGLRNDLAGAIYQQAEATIPDGNPLRAQVSDYTAILAAGTDRISRKYWAKILNSYDPIDSQSDQQKDDSLKQGWGITPETAKQQLENWWHEQSLPPPQLLQPTSNACP